MIRRLTLTVAIAAAVAVVAPALAGAMPIQGPPSLGGPTSKTIQHPTELQANSLYRISNSKANEAFGFLAQPDNQIVTEHSPSQNRVDAVNAAQAVPSEWQSYEAYLTKRANVHPVMGATGRPYEAYLESRGDAAATSSPTITENSASSDGFNWSDARLGGASAAIAAFVLLFGAALVLIRRRGRLAV
jgi:hypothetical protein